MKKTLREVLDKRGFFQEYNNWYVLEDSFSWNLNILQREVFQCMETFVDVPIVFCDTCDANKIAADLGQEEAEIFLFSSGMYWREIRVIFIFSFSDYYELLQTIFHELRHVMQEEITEFSTAFEEDKYRPYSERLTEIDAFHYADYCLRKFIFSHVEN
ncbi:DUF3920 family protein [Priestia koreensis]|uniref:DUF3920 family protein n=1 Tax=Priestia koreensis TaxID=284581 RepID=UPI00345A9D7F